jgi:hypothetical protein
MEIKMSAQLNRQQRRQLKRRGKTDDEISKMTHLDLMQESLQLQAEYALIAKTTLANIYANTEWGERELNDMRLTTYSAFDNLTKCTGTQQDFDGLGMAINVAVVRADDIDPSGLLSSKFTPAIDGFTRMQERHGRTGTLAFDGLGLQAAREALDLYDQILGLSTPRQMMQALKTAMRVVEEMKRIREKADL